MPFLPYVKERDSLSLFSAGPVDTVLLLDAAGNVLSAVGNDAPPLGTAFFRAWHVPREEVAFLHRTLSAPDAPGLFFMAGKQPALAACQFFARTGLFLVFLPQGDVAECLSAPSALADVLSHCHISLSPEALARFAPIKEALYPAAHRYLRERDLSPLLDAGEAEYNAKHIPVLPAEEITLALSRISVTLANLIGINLSYDWCGLGFGHLPDPDLPLALGALTALFFLVRRIARDGAVALLASSEGAEGPIVEALLRVPQEEPLHELLPLSLDARSRAELFTVAKAPGDPELLHVKFSLCRKEISEQGLKADPLFQ